MQSEQFESILENRVHQVYNTLSAKQKEYATDDDRLHNFRVTADMKGETMAQALWGMKMKHTVSVQDMVQSGATPTREWIKEKIGDEIIYNILLEAVFEEMICREEARKSSMAGEATTGFVNMECDDQCCEDPCVCCAYHQPAEDAAEVTVLLPPALTVQGFEQSQKFAIELVSLLKHYNVDTPAAKAA